MGSLTGVNLFITSTPGKRLDLAAHIEQERRVRVGGVAALDAQRVAQPADAVQGGHGVRQKNAGFVFAEKVLAKMMAFIL